MRRITLNSLRKAAHWQIDRELEQCKRLLVTYYGKPLWVLRLAAPEDETDIPTKTKDDDPLLP
jgi:hypothetical protein